MKLLVTGATGFVGSHLLPLLLRQGHAVTVLLRDKRRAEAYNWYASVDCLKVDIQTDDCKLIKNISDFDALIHLAWHGLPHYCELFHIDSNLPADCKFLKSLIQNGIRRVVVTGTCFEYGMQSGELREDLITNPINSYAVAKDSLRKYLQLLQQEYNFTMQWARLFYMHGNRQNPKSLLAQLQAAISNGDSVFNMSAGEQLRDYLPVTQVAEYLLDIIERPNLDGIVNVCSGNPVSVRRLVEGYIVEKQADIKLNLGYYPYSSYEPMAFWGNRDKLTNWLHEN
jgi:nucleoside-diphosphate-sugar epimerase